MGKFQMSKGNIFHIENISRLSDSFTVDISSLIDAGEIFARLDAFYRREQARDYHSIITSAHISWKLILTSYIYVSLLLR